MHPIKPDEILSLPPLPISIVRLSKAVSDPAIELGEYKTIIETDPVLTGSVLRWANSSWSNVRTPITTIDQAVTRLGTDNILQLALGVHMMSTMRKLLGKEDISENEIWRHSLGVALTTKILPEYLPWPVPASTFSAAIVHDVGKIIIARHLTYDGTKKMLDNTIGKSNINYIDAETELLKTNHVILGVEVAQHWKLPESLIDTIAHHHGSFINEPAILSAVQLANAITNKVELSAGISAKDLAEHSAIIEQAGIGDLQMKEIEDKLQEAFQKSIGDDWHH